MADLKLLRGARAPLFDRFGDEDGEGGSAFLPWAAARRGGGGLTLSALEQSIATELDRLLNTRCAASLEQLADRPRSVIDYGLPDYTALHAADLKHRRRLGDLVRDTVAAFEPRLREVQVEVEVNPNSRQALQVAIEGRVVVDGRLEPVSFKVSVREGE
ncbi:type VI secretion system baseplate subunit TssE [Pseudoduganella violaceinigra]|uniref:type VI secretion system baseplate subunit TssE n=1 Tax=Pseudoduganella violaceinigra TaxID=246602 RepID=UPI00040ADE1E|nr:type VI secretion system baseplate subunit TssE [Pseudoduganella violaceinigra]